MFFYALSQIISSALSTVRITVNINKLNEIHNEQFCCYYPAEFKTKFSYTFFYCTEHKKAQEFPMELVQFLSYFKGLLCWILRAFIIRNETCM